MQKEDDGSAPKTFIILQAKQAEMRKVVCADQHLPLALSHPKPAALFCTALHQVHQEEQGLSQVPQEEEAEQLSESTAPLL